MIQKQESLLRDKAFLSFTRNLSNKYEKELLDTATKTGINALKNASKKINS